MPLMRYPSRERLRIARIVKVFKVFKILAINSQRVFVKESKIKS